MDFLENKTFDEISVGDSDSLTRTLTEKDIQIFAILSGDINPAHVDVEYAQSDLFHKIVGHGMWSAALISTVLGTQLPGPGTIYVGQSIEFKKPVAIGDTLTVKLTVIEKVAGKNRIMFDCKCTNQDDQVVMQGKAEVVAPTKKIRRAKTVLPHISLRRPYSLFDAYIKKAKEIGALRTAVIQPIHKKIIEAVNDAYQSRLIKPVLIGPREKIQQAATDAEIDISSHELIDVEHSHAAIMRAMALARDGQVGLIVRGGATREEMLREMRKHENGIRLENVLSYAAVLDVPTYPKALILTDTMINTNPDLDVKRGITQNAIYFANVLEIANPRIAVVAGVDMVSQEMQSTVDAAALCKMAERGQIKGGIIDGPLTFDNIISKEIALSKGITSPVIGEADILVMPNVETGNILAKQLEYLAESRNAGLTLGGRVPVLMSHIYDIYLSTASCALAVLNNHYSNEQTNKG